MLGPGSQRLVPPPQEMGTQAAGRRPDSDPFPGSPGTTRLPVAPSRPSGVRLPAQEAAFALFRELPLPPPQARKTWAMEATAREPPARRRDFLVSEQPRRLPVD